MNDSEVANLESSQIKTMSVEGTGTIKGAHPRTGISNLEVLEIDCIKFALIYKYDVRESSTRESLTGKHSLTQQMD